MALQHAHIQQIQKFAPFIGLLILCIALSILNDSFLTSSNLLTVMRQVSINALIAFGMTFVILTAGIDLSVGSILALAGVICAALITGGASGEIALVLTLLAGAVMGCINGLIITKGKAAPFIATLATMTIFRGLTLAYTEGRPISGLKSDVFELLGNGYIFRLIPIPVVVMFVVFGIAWFILRRMAFGRHVYAIGGNEEASRISGVRVDRVKTLVYGISGTLAAFAGIILTSRLNSASPTAGIGYELDAIAAVVLGGTSLSGGRGWVIGTLVGALLIGVLNNGLNLLGVSSAYQLVVKGVVILFAVLIDRRQKS